ncbi:MAG: hypothetical protein M3Z25_11125 [Actinomycetota bacterium]|nr:hypothetical protein [Actinomycetota bacterium]
MPEEHSAAEPDPDAEDLGGEHAAPDGAPLHPLIDLSRDPTPGKPDHARPDED